MAFAAAGLVCHFAAFGAAMVYYFASRKFRLWSNALVHFVVIPLSAIDHLHYNIATYITGPIGPPLLVGLPIALCVRRFSS